MTFDEIQTMIIRSVQAHYNTYSTDVKEKIIECTTQIYIKQMELEQLKENK